jgi:putative protease
MHRTLPQLEILAPAGDMEKLETAVAYRAGAAYLGGQDLSLRAAASGFSRQELERAVDLAHAGGVRLYYCLNVLARPAELARAEARLHELAGLALDGIIVADLGVARLARRILPDLPLHASTQANTMNAESVRAWADQGATRVNLARELSGRDIRAVARRLSRASDLDLASASEPDTDRRSGLGRAPDSPAVELEVFAHGAMCLALSGQCLLSDYVTGRSANRGACTHPCRFEYREAALVLEEKLRPGEDLWEVRDCPPPGSDVVDPEDAESREAAPGRAEETAASGGSEEGGREGRAGGSGFSEILARQDLCLLPYLRFLARCGVRAAKIEGRTKSSAYLAQALDVYATAARGELRSLADYRRALDELSNAATRPLATGFFLPNRTVLAGPPARKRPVVARVLERLGEDAWLVQAKARWDALEGVDILVPGLARPRLECGTYGLEGEDGHGLTLAHPGGRAVLRGDFPELAPGLFLRRA